MNSVDIPKLIAKRMDNVINSEITKAMTSTDPELIEQPKPLTFNDMLRQLVELRLGKPVQISEHVSSDTAFCYSPDKEWARWGVAPIEDIYIMHPDFALKLLNHR